MADPGMSSPNPPALDIPGLPPLSVIDIETSGLTASRHRILQVAVVRIDGSLGRSEWSTLVSLPHRFSRVGPRRVHGITRSDLAGAPPWTDVAPELASRVSDSVVVAHNIGFDWPFIVHHARSIGVDMPDVERLCTLTLSRALDPDHRVSHRLPDACARYGITHHQPHHALHDARVTADLLPHLLREHGAVDAESLRRLYESR